ncbi:UNVERIFIED_CONTAM: hypothetical protein NCL1_41723 [Trichonephila clavipes]
MERDVGMLERDHPNYEKWSEILFSISGVLIEKCFFFVTRNPIEVQGPVPVQCVYSSRCVGSKRGEWTGGTLFCSTPPLPPAGIAYTLGGCSGDHLHFAALRKGQANPDSGFEFCFVAERILLDHKYLLSILKRTFLHLKGHHVTIIANSNFCSRDNSFSVSTFVSSSSSITVPNSSECG